MKKVKITKSFIYVKEYKNVDRKVISLRGKVGNIIKERNDKFLVDIDGVEYLVPKKVVEIID